jgi:hypothetical protein
LVGNSELQGYWVLVVADSVQVHLPSLMQRGLVQMWLVVTAVTIATVLGGSRLALFQ